jgi:hypothetical protein
MPPMVASFTFAGERLTKTELVPFSCVVVRRIGPKLTVRQVASPRPGSRKLQVGSTLTTG